MTYVLPPHRVLIRECPMRLTLREPNFDYDDGRLASFEYEWDGEAVIGPIRSRHIIVMMDFVLAIRYPGSPAYGTVWHVSFDGVPWSGNPIFPFPPERVFLTEDYCVNGLGDLVAQGEVRLYGGNGPFFAPTPDPAWAGGEDYWEFFGPNLGYPQWWFWDPPEYPQTISLHADTTTTDANSFEACTGPVGTDYWPEYPRWIRSRFIILVFDPVPGEIAVSPGLSGTARDRQPHGYVGPAANL